MYSVICGITLCATFNIISLDKTPRLKNLISALTSIAGLVHVNMVNDLDLTTQILVSPCHTSLGSHVRFYATSGFFCEYSKSFFLIHTFFYG